MRILILLYVDPHIILIKDETKLSIHLYHKIGQLSAVVVDHPKQSVPGDPYGDTCVNLTMIIPNKET